MNNIGKLLGYMVSERKIEVDPSSNIEDEISANKERNSRILKEISVYQ